MRKLIKHLDRYQIFYLLIFCLFLTFNIHSKSKIQSYHHVLWADGAGYYMYLPAAFSFQFSAKNVPDSLEAKTGGGFVTDKENDLIKIKYTYGVALLELPFYLIAEIVESISSEGEDDFGKIHHRMIMISGVFYLILGLFFLKKALTCLYSSGIASLTILFIFCTSTLFYYGIHKNSYSHVYLFFLFAFIFHRSLILIENRTFRNYLWVIIPFSLAVLIRPTSILIFPLMVFIKCRDFSEMNERAGWLLEDMKKIIPAILISVLLWIPQFIYWEYISGSFISYSYSDEGFSFLNSPHLSEFWFSAKNGLFPYSPVFFILLFLILRGMKTDTYNFVLLLVFLFASYLFASWFDWTFGCSYGSRSITEYVVFFAIPLAGFLKYCINLNNKLPLILTCCILTYLSYVNINTVYSYDDCYYGEIWDFETFLKVVKLV